MARAHNRLRRVAYFAELGLLALLCLLIAPLKGNTNDQLAAHAAGNDESVRFAVIGDYGSAGDAEADVASLVRNWNPDFVITTGDNNYPDPPSTVDDNIGQYYSSYIGAYKGKYGPGASDNRFFPTLGNEDWATDGAQSYFDYFVLPGNERYYDFVEGPVHFYALDSDPHEPDGITQDSTQARRLQSKLAADPEPWKIVYFHHPPYSSGQNGPTRMMQWPFAQWGASAVMSGHDHDYERLSRDGASYFVNGLGGRSRSGFGEPVEGSVIRFAGDYGAMLVEGDAYTMTYRFITRSEYTVDTLTECRQTDWHPGLDSCLVPVEGGRQR